MEADWIIGLGPEGGTGGNVVARGTPEQLEAAAAKRAALATFLTHA